MKKGKRKDRFFSKEENKKVNNLVWQAQCDLHADDYVIMRSETKKDKKSNQSGNYVISAQITVRPKYFTAELEISPNLRKMFRQDFDAFIKIIYHEVAHIIIDPLYLDQYDELSPIEKVYFNEKREQAVEKVCRIARWKRNLQDKVTELEKGK